MYRKGHLCASKAHQNFFFKRPALYTFVKAGEKSKGKALLLDEFLSYLGSHNLQTQAVILGKHWTSIHLPSWWAASDAQTDWLTDWLTGAWRASQWKRGQRWYRKGWSLKSTHLILTQATWRIHVPHYVRSQGSGVRGHGCSDNLAAILIYIGKFFQQKYTERT